MLERSASLEDLARVLDAARVDFSVKPVPRAAAARWRLAEGAISHETGGFFDLVGVEFDSSPGQGQVLIYQPQSAVTGLLLTAIGGELHFLLHARAAPGTLGIAQFGPTVQATPANYLRLHGGNPLPHLGLFHGYARDARIVGDTMQFDLGERYLKKTKRLMLVQCPVDIAQRPNYTWVPARIITQAVLRSALLNPDLRSLLAVMPWSAAGGGEGIRPISAEVRASLAAPLRAEVLGAMMADLARPAPRARFADIGALDNWRLTDRGLFEIEDRQGFDVEFYEVHLSGREVATWFQPLINSRGQGRAALYCRYHGDRLEVFAGLGSEQGLSAGAALLPSHLRYPGRSRPTYAAFGEASPDELGGETLVSTLDPDEGERFYHDISRCELIRLPYRNDRPRPGTGAWLTVAELKAFLAQSNVCSIQLRGLASMLLGVD